MLEFAGTPPPAALYRARRPPPQAGEAKETPRLGRWSPSGPARKLIEIGDRAQPKNPFSPLLLQRNEPTNFRHPVLIDLPDRPEQRFRGRHLRQSRRRGFEPARRPPYLPLRREPKMHPQRHVDQDDVGRTGKPCRN